MKLISLGENCQVAWQIEQATKLKGSSFFNWIVSPIKPQTDLINVDFENVFEKDDLHWDEHFKGVLNSKNGLIYYHLFPRDDDDRVSEETKTHNFEMAKEKVMYLAQKWREDARTPDAVFIRRCYSDVSEIEKLYDAIQNFRHGAPFRMIWANRPGMRGIPSRPITVIGIPEAAPGPDSWKGDGAVWQAALAAILAAPLEGNAVDIQAVLAKIESKYEQYGMSEAEITNDGDFSNEEKLLIKLVMKIVDLKKRGEYGQSGATAG